jgi:hypothetical protein
MALEPYTPEQLDGIALRIFDVCAQIREIARRSREQGLDHVALHDKKALEWLGKLEEWAAKSRRDFELAQFKQRGARAAAAALRREAGQADASIQRAD